MYVNYFIRVALVGNILILYSEFSNRVCILIDRPTTNKATACIDFIAHLCTQK